MLPPSPISARTATGVPLLVVSDVDAALEYYRSVLGFSAEGRAGPAMAFLRGHGTYLQLRQAADGEAARSRSNRGEDPDAILLVDNPRVLRRRLDGWGADILPAQQLRPGWAGFFGVVDPDGNVLAFGPATGPVATVKQWIGGPLDDLARRVHERNRAREEAVHLEELRTFYHGLTDKHAVFYLFFSENLLHWVTKAISYVPDHVNLVLLGSALPADEIDWVAANIDRPFHNVRLRIDDRIAWEFLFAVNEHHFGWLDSDCMVLNHGLFDELSDIDSKTSLNCTWAWDSGFGWPLANTFFLFVNVDVIAAVRARGAEPNPCSHDYDWHSLRVPGRRCYSRTPSPGQRRLLREILPLDDGGRPATPHGMTYYDTMVLYQLLARACGSGIRRVRELEGFGHLRGRPVQDESSDELLHIGGGSRADPLSDVTGFFHTAQTRLLYLIAESVMLGGAPEGLPPYYPDRLERMTAALARHQLTPQQAEETIRRHLIQDRGLSPDGATAALGRPATAT